jgi:RNA polymerase sigma-70 factor (ECF subfamily)
MKIRPLNKPVEITYDFLKLCAKDDRKAINVLYEHCFHMLLPICFRYNKNEEDARAAYNTGFIKILKGLGKLDENVNFTAWAKRLMINSLIDEYRKNKKYNERITRSDSERDLDFYSTGVDNNAESNLGCENILMLIETLPETTAQVFNLYVIDGFAHKEIAAKLEMSEGTSKWHLSTARKILREKIEKLENQNKRMVI